MAAFSETGAGGGAAPALDMVVSEPASEKLLTNEESSLTPAKNPDEVVVRYPLATTDPVHWKAKNKVAGFCFCGHPFSPLSVYGTSNE